MSTGSSSPALVPRETPDSVPAVRFDPFGAEFRADPYALYARFRERDPVHWGVSPIPRMEGCWYVFEYDDVSAVLKDERIGREAWRVLPAQAFPPPPSTYRAYCEMTRRWMLFRDPPEHTRLRAQVNRAFTRRPVDDLEPRIHGIAHRLIDAALARGEMELIADFALPLPVTVIADVLGVPVDDFERFRGWSNALTRAIDLQRDERTLELANEATLELSVYLERVIAERRQSPRDDLLSRLIAADEGGTRLSTEELIAMCALLVVAGHETTVNLIGNGVRALLMHRGELERLRGEPALDAGAVEEILRYDGPVQMTFRVALEDLELRGRSIRKGQGIAAVLASANRDPRVFPEPERFDVARASNPQLAVAPHLAFALGLHFCVGAPLARAEGRIALRALLDRLPALDFAGERDAWREIITFRGLQRLPLRF